jgi:hypothetical protein
VHTLEVRRLPANCLALSGHFHYLSDLVSEGRQGVIASASVLHAGLQDEVRKQLIYFDLAMKPTTHF